MRETPSRGRVGRGLPGREDKRYLSAVDFLLAVPQVPALFSTESRSLQGKIAKRSGERCEASVETHQRITDE